MPAEDTHGGGPIDNTSRRERDEVSDDIIDAIRDVSDVFRDRNSIRLSPNFHLDARHVDDGYKVEIQRRAGNKKTVSCVVVSESASLEDLREGLEGSLGTKTVWRVT